MKVEETPIPGLLVIVPMVHRDQRGLFAKTFHVGGFRELKLPVCVAEEFFSTSRRNVIRGMHLQVPPAAYFNVVTCVSGDVLDVVLDVRRASPTYGKAVGRELSGKDPELLLVPTGCAHGFLALSNEATMYYRTSAAHSPQHDAGVRWDSFGWQWPVENPILSDRDRHLPPLFDFQSPFEFEGS